MGCGSDLAMGCCHTGTRVSEMFLNSPIAEQSFRNVDFVGSKALLPMPWPPSVAVSEF